MRREFWLILSLSLFFLFTYLETHPEDQDVVTLPEIDISSSPNGIVPLPENVPSIFSDVFMKYTKVIAPNGKPIHFLAQSDWTDDKLIKARNILEHMLTDYPGSQYGSDKTKVANSMSNRKAAMVLFDNSQAAREAMPNPPEGCNVCHYLYDI